METKVKYFECSCADEILRVEYEPDITQPETVQFAIYEHSLNHQNYETQSTKWDFLMLWMRLKYAVWHLWTGKIHTDSMLLDSKTCKEFGEFLLECVKDKENIAEIYVNKLKEGEQSI